MGLQRKVRFGTWLILVTRSEHSAHSLLVLRIVHAKEFFGSALEEA